MNIFGELKLKYIIYVLVAVLVTIIFNDIVVAAQVTGSAEEIKVKADKTIEKAEEIINPTLTPSPTPVSSQKKVKQYLENNYPNSPMINLVDYVYSRLPEDKALRLFAIAGAESGFGTNGYVAINCNNYFGYLYYGTKTRGCYSPRWNTPENAVGRYIDLESNGWLADDDFTGYCITGCEHWQNNYNYFKNVLSNE